MHIQEEVVIGLLAFLAAFACWIWAVVDEGKSRTRKLPGRSDPSQGLGDVEDRL